MSTLRITIGMIALGTLVSPSSGVAGNVRRTNVLDGQPAVRHRVLLVRGRFELTPTFDASINSDFRHTLSGGLKLAYHLSDMLSVGAIGMWGTSINTGLTSRIRSTLDAPEPPTPSRSEFDQHLNSTPTHGAVYVSLTPWYGKLAAFGRAFVAFDFYFSGGLSMAWRTNSYVNPNPNPTEEEIEASRRNPNDDDPLNDGLALGVFLGGGMHVFVNEWMAIDLSFGDYWFPDNPSGLDFNADRMVTDDDRRLLHHLYAGIGLSVMLPLRAERTP